MSDNKKNLNSTATKCFLHQYIGNQTIIISTALFLAVHGAVIPGRGGLGSGAATGGQSRADAGVAVFEENRTGVQS